MTTKSRYLLIATSLSLTLACTLTPIAARVERVKDDTHFAAQTSAAVNTPALVRPQIPITLDAPRPCVAEKELRTK